MKYYEYTTENAKNINSADIVVASPNSDNTKYIISTEATLSNGIQEFDSWQASITWGNNNDYNMREEDATNNLYIPEISSL